MNKRLAYLLGLVFILRLAALFVLGRHLNPQTWEYDTLALNMLEHKGYSITHLNTVYHCFGYPAYSFVCAFLHWLTNRNYFVIEMFQIILAVFSSYFVYKTAEKIFNEKVGMLALFFSAVHPGLIVYSTKMHELTFTVFFVTLLFFLMTRINIFGWRDNMLLGVLIGLGALTRPTAVLFFPSYLVYIFLISRSVKKILKPSFIVFIMMALVILPWALRNYSIHKRYILLTTTSAEHLWRGNNPFSSGTALTLENKDILSAAPIDFQQMVYSRNEIQQHDLFCSQALKYIMADPARFARSTLKKIFYFWWFAPQSGLWYLRAWLVIYKIFYSFILIFFILGLYSGFQKLSRQGRIAVAAILLFIALTSVSHGLYYTEIRHRWVIEPLLMIISAYGLLDVLGAQS